MEILSNENGSTDSTDLESSEESSINGGRDSDARAEDVELMEARKEIGDSLSEKSTSTILYRDQACRICIEPVDVKSNRSRHCFYCNGVYHFSCIPSPASIKINI